MGFTAAVNDASVLDVTGNLIEILAINVRLPEREDVVRPAAGVR